MTAGEKQKAGIKEVRGTREWAVAEINCSLGCPHGCKYCYARYDMVKRRGLLSQEEWSLGKTVAEEVIRQRPLYPGQIMFPTAHDIVPANLAACMTVLGNLLDAGNKVLVVSKPHLDCIRALCAKFGDMRDKLLFRFTITARHPEVLAIWEPQTPGYEERKSCLEFAFREGFATSVSVEPMLDTEDVVSMVYELLPFVSHTIWLGKMNKIDERVVVDSVTMRLAVEMLKKGQEDVKILKIYQELAGIPQVRWKDSVKQVVGLASAEKPGLDI